MLTFGDRFGGEEVGGILCGLMAASLILRVGRVRREPGFDCLRDVEKRMKVLQKCLWTMWRQQLNFTAVRRWMCDEEFRTVKKVSREDILSEVIGPNPPALASKSTVQDPTSKTEQTAVTPPESGGRARKGAKKKKKKKDKAKA
jgi:hypothetical protein